MAASGVLMHVIAKMANAPNFTFKFAKSSTLSKKVSSKGQPSKTMSYTGVLIFSQKDMLRLRYTRKAKAASGRHSYKRGYIPDMPVVPKPSLGHT